MRFAVEDSRHFPQDHTWGIGIDFSRFDREYSLDVGFGYRSVMWSWGEQLPLPPARTVGEVMQRVFNGWTWGLSVCRLAAEGWTVRVGPWLWDVMVT